ncbi:MAG: hypothetical protein RI900_1675 [Actinomycetota bacterium]|jgi:hypothetical protein
MSTPDADPRSLSLAELRSVRSELQHLDDAVSYVRRLVQARLDLARAEQRHRGDGDAAGLNDELPSILGAQLTGGQARPPRPADDFSEHPLAIELERLCSGAADLTGMDDESLQAYIDALAGFERLRSAERKELFGRIDELSAELVRRFREGEADVDGLMVLDVEPDAGD